MRFFVINANATGRAKIPAAYLGALRSQVAPIEITKYTNE
jgi:hypothetical protein